MMIQSDSTLSIGVGLDTARYGHHVTFLRQDLQLATEPFGFIESREGYDQLREAFHELTHWSGHESRLDRKHEGGQHREQYAREELVAELGAAFLCADLGITNDPRQDHAQYLTGFLQVLRSDKRAIFTAASQAQKAVEYLQLTSQPKQVAA